MSRVLVVDDDQGVRNVVKTVLERRGYDVTAAEDGRSAITAVEDEKFDVVIVDIFMPGMDGLETIRMFNRHAPAVPVIAISGFLFRDSSNPAPDFLSMATKLGAAYSLHKPFRPSELVRVVEACLAAGEAPATPDEAPPLRRSVGT